MSCIVFSAPTKMNSTIGLNVSTGDTFSDSHHSKMGTNTLPDATGSLFGNKNKFLQLARRLRHTLNHSQLSSQLQCKHSKQSSMEASMNVTSKVSSHSHSHHSTKVVPAVASLAVAAAAAVASPISQQQIRNNFSKMSAVDCHSAIHDHNSDHAISSSDLNRLNQEKRNGFRHFCGLRLPGGKSNGSSSSSSRASSISSSGCSHSSSGFSSCGAASDLSLLQTLALCSLELAAPASEVLLHNRRSSNQHHQHHHHQQQLQQQQQQHSNDSVQVPFTFGNLNNTYDHQMDVTFAPSLECKSNFINNSVHQEVPSYQPPTDQPAEFIQLSGHRDCFQRRSGGRVWKRLSEQPSHELRAYEKINQEPCLQSHVAAFYGQKQDLNGHWFVELGDLLSEFRHPAWLMDIKMGSRTFLEKEVLNAEARSDLFVKMEKTLRTGGEQVSGQQLLTEQEREQRALTKLRYMTLREQLSSSSTLGFRVEAYKCNGNAISNDLQYVRQPDQVQNIMSEFLPAQHHLRHELVQLLRQLRQDLLTSDFFHQHEMIGSSLLIVHDTQRVGVWMIDFAKTIPLPSGVHIDHQSEWAPGNHEDGYLFGLNNLIRTLETL